ncbi:MAG: 4-hydroxybenzoyl-CoA thioesterase [Candidatus Rokuibacteriota bacterium]|nr:MAG: 4-hydroxybenzoyl-CoA thioesterase [Candidatus Rokubacteria bacterium]
MHQLARARVRAGGGLSPSHAVRSRVAWVDTDAGGRIHFTAAFRWAEQAETGLMRSLGLLERWGSYPRRRVEAEYHKVLRFEDEIETTIRVERVGRTSITYVWAITKDAEAYVEGRHTVVLVDEQGRPKELPEQMRAVLER